MRLIDADALPKLIIYQPSDEVKEIINVFTRAIAEAPTIDAEPVKHGKWILTNKPNIYGGTTIKCSVCGYEGVVAHIEDHHYCWVCGARMDEEEVGE